MVTVHHMPEKVTDGVYHYVGSWYCRSTDRKLMKLEHSTCICFFCFRLSQDNYIWENISADHSIHVFAVCTYVNIASLDFIPNTRHKILALADWAQTPRVQYPGFNILSYSVVIVLGRTSLIMATMVIMITPCIVYVVWNVQLLLPWLHSGHLQGSSTG